MAPSSTQQPQTALLSVEDALKKFGQNPPIELMGTVAVALAREAVFGEGVMAVSTVGGKGQAKALPIDGAKRSIIKFSPYVRHFIATWRNLTKRFGQSAKLP